MSSSFKALEDEFEFVLDEVMGIALCAFFGIISLPSNSSSSVGGGGGCNDLPHKKKDDDEELLRARNIARSIAKSCPKKVVHYGFRR